MKRDLSAAELEALDWAMELDQRAARSLVRDDIREAMEWGDTKSAALCLGAAEWCESLEAMASVGLVSVPTSDTPGRRSRFRPAIPFRVGAEGQKLREALEAFAITSDQTRLMRLRR